jgi:hypothetical protein
MQQVWIKWSEKCQKNLPNVLAYKKLKNKLKNDFLTVIHWSCTIIANTETNFINKRGKWIITKHSKNGCLSFNCFKNLVQFGNGILECFPKNEILEIVKLNAKYGLWPIYLTYLQLTIGSFFAEIVIENIGLAN